MTCRLIAICLAAFLFASGCALSPAANRGSFPAGPKAPEAARIYSDFMIARVASMTNDPATASKAYAALIDVAPGEAELAERAIFSALLAGHYGTAAGLARRARDAGSDASLVRLTLAAEGVIRNRPRDVTAALEGADFRYFNKILAHGLRAWQRVSAGEPSAAEALLRGALTGDSRLDVGTLYQIGFVRLAAGDTAGAIENFDALWRAGARFGPGAAMHAQLLAARGEPAAASALLRDYLDQSGAHPAVSAMARRLEAGETVTAPQITFRQGAALALYLPAATLAAQTKDDLPAVYLELALALDPGLDAARTLLADVLDRSDRNRDALRVLGEIRPQSEYYAMARGEMAAILVEEGRGDEALALAGEALAARPDRSLRLRLADLYRALERHGEAERVLDTVIAADAKDGRSDWRAIFLRGAARERQDKWTEAEADLKEALARAPDNATLLNYLGYSWVDRGLHLEEGLRLIERAVALEPQSGHIVDSLGWAHYRLGNYELAIEHLERAVDLLPSDPVLNDHLGDAYWKAGRRLEAGYQWQRALRLTQTEKDRILIEAKLAGGLAPAAATAPPQAGK